MENKKQVPVEKEKTEILECESNAEDIQTTAENQKRHNINIAKIGIPILCACIAFVIVLVTVIIPKQRTINTSLKKLKAAKVGDYVFFGTYEQDNNTTNGKEDIEWQVLDIKDGKMLVISKYALDCQPYNTELTDVTWETCSLRNWLNNTFYSGTFTEDERALIADSTVYAQANPQYKYSTDPGNDTTDKVFLLSINEVEEYFSSNEERMCVPTAYAIENGAYTSTHEKGGSAWWWLRSPGDSQANATGVFVDGSVDYDIDNLFSGLVAVRPALWINLNT